MLQYQRTHSSRSLQEMSAVAANADALASETRKNLELAHHANDGVHAENYNLEKDSFLSHNKRFMDIELYYEQERTDKALEEIKKLWGLNIHIDVEEVSRLIPHLKAHVCDTLAHDAEDRVLKENPGAHTARLIFKGYHAVLMIGTLPPEYLKKDMNEWPSHVVICDPWSGDCGKGKGGLVCQAKDYRAKVKEEMVRMEEERGLEVLCNGDWVDSGHEDWLKFLDAEKEMGVRKKTETGSIRYVWVSKDSKDAGDSFTL